MNPNAGTGSIFGAYYWAGTVYACQATFFAWANDAMRWEEDSLRAVVIASMNCGSNAVNAWWSLLFYAADMAPKFTVSPFLVDKGEQSGAVFGSEMQRIIPTRRVRLVESAG